MTPTALAQVVARLYTAAGRNYGKVELEVWSEALDDINDDEAIRASKALVKNVDLMAHPPAPKVLRDAVLDERKRIRDATPALPTVAGPLLPVEESLRRLHEAKKAIRHVDEAIA